VSCKKKMIEMGFLAPSMSIEGVHKVYQR
jgi:hypothetical protein